MISTSSIREQLVRDINNISGLVFINDFLYLGSPEAVNMAFCRLAKENIIQRLAKGIYYHSKRNSNSNTLVDFPSMEAIAEAIALKQKVLIKPTGIYALNKLGILTSSTKDVIYLTDGSSRKIKVGAGFIYFIHTTPRKLAPKGNKSFLVIQALLELGRDRINPNIIDKIEDFLKTEDVSTIHEDAKLTPIWIAQILYQIVNKRSNNIILAQKGSRGKANKNVQELI